MADLLDGANASASVDVNAPAAVTWEMMTDIHAGQTALPGVRFDVPDPDAPFAVGFQWSETPASGGDPTYLEVAAHDPEAMTYTVIDKGPLAGMRQATRVMVTPTGPATCRLTMTFGTVGGPALLRWLMKVGSTTVGRRLAAASASDDLRQLAAAAERRAAPGMPSASP